MDSGIEVVGLKESFLQAFIGMALGSMTMILPPVELPAGHEVSEFEEA